MALIALAIAALVCAPSQASSQPAEYTSTELFRIYFGSGPNQVGVKIAEGDFVGGPGSFIFNKQGIFVVHDWVNSRIVLIDQQGKMIRHIKPRESPAGRANLIEDESGRLWFIGSRPDGANPKDNHLFCEVFDTKGNSLGLKWLPNDIASLSSVLGQDGRAYLTHSVSTFERGTGKPTITKRESFSLNGKELIPERQEKFPPYIIQKKGKNLFASQEGKEVVIRDGRGSIISRIKGHPTRIDAEGDIYFLRSLRNIEMFNVYGKLKATAHLTGKDGAAGVFIDSDGTIYQLDYIPNVTDHEIGTMRPAPSDMDRESLHYDLNTPGMRLMKWTKK